MENDVFNIPLCSGNSLNPFIEINCTLTIEKLFKQQPQLMSLSEEYAKTVKRASNILFRAIRLQLIGRRCHWAENSPSAVFRA